MESNIKIITIIIKKNKPRFPPILQYEGTNLGLLLYEMFSCFLRLFKIRSQDHDRLTAAKIQF